MSLVAMNGIIRRGRREFVATARNRATERRYLVTVQEGSLRRTYAFPIRPSSKFTTGVLQRAVDLFVAAVAGIVETPAPGRSSLPRPQTDRRA